jgi:hypothetical protein
METSNRMRSVVDDRQRVWERWLLSQSSRAERTQTKPRRGRAVSPAVLGLAHVFIPSKLLPIWQHVLNCSYEDRGHVKKDTTSLLSMSKMR